MIIDILILDFLWLTSIASAVGIGFYFGSKVKKHKKAYMESQSEKQEHEALRFSKELHNMLTYDGTPQSDINMKM